MQKRPGLCHEQLTNHGQSQKTNISSAKLLLEKQQLKKVQTSPANTNDTQKSSRNKSHKGYPNIQYGTMPSNCYRAHLVLCQDDYYPLLKKKSRKQRSSLRSTCDEIQSDHHGAHMQPTSSLSKRKMASSNQYRTTVRSTNGRRRIEMYPLSFPPSSTDFQAAPFSPNSTSDGVTTTYASSQAMNGKPPSSCQKDYLNPL